MAIPFHFVYRNTSLELQEKSPAWNQVCHNLLCAECGNRYTDFNSYFPQWVNEDFDYNKRQAQSSKYPRRPKPVKYGFCTDACRTAAESALAKARKFIQDNTEALEVLTTFRKVKEAANLQAKMSEYRKDVEYYGYYTTH